MSAGVADAFRRLPRWALRVAIAVGVLGMVLAYVFGAFPVAGWPAVPEDIGSALKFAIGALALVGLSVERVRFYVGRPLQPRYVKAGAAILAACAVTGYLNFGDLGYARVYHRWEAFHYYLGAKYHNELGYKRIYQAAAMAQLEDEPAIASETRARSVRDLETDVVVPVASIIPMRDEIKAPFSAPRWEAFRADVHWFRAQCSAGWWSDMQADHGYNASPVWALGGSLVASLGVAGDGYFRFVAALDLLIFGALFYAIAWAFGWRTLCLTLIFWGTQWPANFVFTWGSILRQDWILLLVLSVCLLKKRYWALAGAALTYSALLRVFPAVFFFGPLAVAVVHVARFRRVKKEHLRFGFGSIAALIVLVGAATATLGPRSMGEFARHIAHHNASPTTNLMGVPAIAAFTWDGRVDATFRAGQRDPYAVWKAGRAVQTAHRKGIRTAVSVLVVLLVAWAAAGSRSLLLATLTCVLLPVGLLEMTNYYYSFFLLVPIAASLDRRLEAVALGGATLSAVAVLWGRIASGYDVRCVAQSWVFLGMATVCVVLLSRRSWPLFAKREFVARPS